MTLEMIRQEEKEAGIQEGAYQAKLETARNLKRMNLSVSQIADATGLSIEEVEKL